MKFLSFTIKGLEEIAAKEIKRTFEDAEIRTIEPKLIVWVSQSATLQDLRKLSVCDDVAVWVDKIKDMNSLNHQTLGERMLEIEYAKAIDWISQFREVDRKRFSLTISLPSLEYLRSIPFKEYFAKLYADEKKKVYLDRDHSNIDIRVFRGENELYVGIKANIESLHKRAYKQYFRRGSLRPTIAAGLVEVATEGFEGDSGNLVDNFCGSGTILCEAFLKGHKVFGGDIHKGSVTNTLNNLEILEFREEEDHQIEVRNAIETNLPKDYFDFAVSNLPWGKQIETEKMDSLVDGALKEYKRILKAEKSTLVLLTKHPDIVKDAAARIFSNADLSFFEISLMGQQPEVIVIRR